MIHRYFDHNATTPVSAEVLEALLPCLTEAYGNASSIHHYGQEAKQKLETARRQVSALLGCDSKELVFVSGGTEADNLAVFGAVAVAERRTGPGGGPPNGGDARGVFEPPRLRCARVPQKPRKHIVTSAIEHPAVLNACAQLEREGVSVTYVAPDSQGVVSPDAVRSALRDETVLVSVMHANNELGTVQPIEAIARVAHEAGAWVHSDGVQAAGKLQLDLKALGVDLYSISGHKIYAPKGIGALYVRGGLKLSPMLFGGRHESGRRAGTENVAGAAGLGRAAQWYAENGNSERERLTRLRDHLERKVLETIPDVRINGSGAARTSNTSSITFSGIEGEALLIALDLKGFAVSSGAACSSGAVEPSHVLTAIGLSREQARSTLRFSLGRSNDEIQVDDLVAALAESVHRLRRLSPSYA